MSDLAYITIKQNDGYLTKLTHYICPQNPSASILILHGMAEHQKRYQSFAEYLVNQGFDVFTYDHRGHGTDKKLSDLGYFSSESGYQLVINDAINVSTHIEQNNRSNKLFLLGHSMGSIIARNVIQAYDKYQGVILSGTTYPPRILTNTGLLISSLITKVKGPKHISPFMNNLMFGSKKYTSLSTRTAFDWLSRSNTIVGAYIHDPYCGYICTSSFYHDLLKMIKNIIKRKHIRLTRKDLPLYIISGTKDPVSSYGKEIQKYFTILKKCEFRDISNKLYTDCRHEILNEINNTEVYSDIYQWITNKL